MKLIDEDDNSQQVSKFQNWIKNQKLHLKLRNTFFPLRKEQLKVYQWIEKMPLTMPWQKLQKCSKNAFTDQHDSKLQ
jgi:hypothetical protein